MSTIQISDSLHERLSSWAAQRGESVEAFVEEAVKERLQALEAERDSLALPPERVALLEALAEARAEYAASGEPWLDWEGIEREVAERRGGYQWADE
ncbi:MAG: hypothetical protein M3220_00355 [Chloroflexota bacterium]|nr:hypothetical protein [Chloroflexota bacterium]